MFSSFNISASGMTAQRLRLDIIANNLANANTTRTETGGPYQRQVPIFSAREGRPSFTSYIKRGSSGGVRVIGIGRDPSPAQLLYDPGHPDADENGYVAMPNVNVVTEMTDLIAASRAYEANVTAFNAAKTIAGRVLEMGR